MNIHGQEWTSKLDPVLSSLYKINYAPINKALADSNNNKVSLLPIGEALTYKNENDINDPIVRVFIKSSSTAEELTASGANVNSKVGDIYTAHIPISKLQDVAGLTGVLAIQMGMPLEKELDASAPAVRAPLARSTFGRTGQGVVIAILDVGIDYNNDDFKNADGTTRILYIWDQINNNGTKPSGYSYGSEWNSASINNGTCTETDNNGHGTFVAGIAAGNGRATGNGQPGNTYVGIAPNADIIVVKVDFSNNANFIDALTWVGQKCAALDKPWVANISSGNQFGPHDGTSLYEQAIYGVTNQSDLGKGRIIVKSAGNNGFDPNNTNSTAKNRIHMSGNGYSNALFTVNSSDGTTEEYLFMEIWYPEATDYSITLTAPDGTTYGPFSKGHGVANDNPDYGIVENDGFVFLHNENWNDNSIKRSQYPLTEDNLIYIILSDLDFNGDGTIDYHIRSGTWTISMNSGSGRWDAYMPSTGSSTISSGAYFNSDSYDNSRIISEPGNANNIITVGSFNTKNSWVNANGATVSANGFDINEVSYFSSPGPTRDGRDKPELYAPGAWIASTRTNDVTTVPTDQNLLSRDGVHYNGIGTSFAAPHVTGAIALLLEQNPNYSFADIRDILNDSKTINGFLDVYAALDINEDPTGIEDAISIISGPAIINPGTTVTYEARFIDHDPMGDNIYNFNWNIVLFYEGGTYTYYSLSTSYLNYSLCSFSAPTYPTNYQWIRNEDGLIAGKVIVSGTDNDGVFHETKMDIGIPLVPSRPIIYSYYPGQNKINLSFLSSGASSYKIYYDTNSGDPYAGTGAAQGNSPINVGNVTSYSLSGLSTGVTYYIVVKGINDKGESVYSQEVAVKPITTTGTLQNNETWYGRIELSGNVIVPAGLTLTILPGTYITFNSNYSLNINGQLLAEGIDTSRIVFDKKGTGSITLNGANGSVIKYANILNGDRLEAINSSNVLIQYCQISNSYDGIRFSNSSGFIISNNISLSSIGHGIIIEDASTATCQQNVITKTSSPRRGGRHYIPWRLKWNGQAE
jgi:subtilisin family serine protease